MVVGKIVRKGNFLHERKANPKTLEKRGFTEKRTVIQGDHRIIIYGKKGADGRFTETKTQAVLHPLDEKRIQREQRGNF
jgi:hypothetical protein